MIVASHLMPIAIAGSSQVAALATVLLGLFGMYVMPIAVPTFFLVSLTLYFAKPALTRRLGRLIPVFAFWVGLQYALYMVVLGGYPPLDLQTLTKGGPSLTGISSYPSVFWFLFDLIVLTILAEAFRHMCLRLGRNANFLSWALIAVSLTGFAACEAFGRRVDHWSLVNFLVYIPLAWILTEREAWQWRPFAAAFVGLTIVELALAWATPSASVLEVSGYARVAIPAGATALFLWGRRTGDHPKLQWFGRNSLGIYALHDTLRILLLGMPTFLFRWAGLTISLTIVTSVVALALTLLATWALSRTRLRRFVS